MGVLAYWVAFPAIVLALALGLAQALSRVLGRRLPEGLGLPLGLAMLVSLANLGAVAQWLPKPVMWGVVAVAAVGVLLGLRERRFEVDRVAVATGALVFAVLAAPHVLSGQATFGGYGSIGDPGFQMVGIDHLLDVGISGEGLPLSAQSRVWLTYYASAYPTGGYFAAAIPTRLMGGTGLYSLQPFVVLFGTAAATATYALVRLELRAPRRWAAAAGVTTALWPLSQSYAQQASFKEVAASAMLLTLAACVAWVLHDDARRPSPRLALSIVVAVAAVLGVIGVGAGPWLAAGLLLTAVLLVVGALRARSSVSWAVVRRYAAVVLVVVSGIALLAYPGYIASYRLVAVAQAVLTTQQETGNLMQPMSWWQVIAMWPAEDFRLPLETGQAVLAIVSAMVVGVLVIAGTVTALGRRAYVIAGLVIATAIALWSTVGSGSPYADAKAAALSAPLLALGAASFAPTLRERLGRGAVGAAALLIVLVGANSVLIYRGVLLAPRERLEELRGLDRWLETQPRGPVLMTEFEEYAKAAMRNTQLDVAGETVRGRTLFEAGPGDVFYPLGKSSGVEEIRPSDLRPFRWLIQRRGPAYGAPGPEWRLARSTEHYVVYRRVEPGVSRLAPVETSKGAGRNETCFSYRGRRRTAYVRARPIVLTPSLLSGPSTLRQVQGALNLNLELRRAASVYGTVLVPRSGRYDVWVEGTFSRGLGMEIDGKRLTSIARYTTNSRLQPEPMGAVDLRKGERLMRVTWSSGGLRPASGRGLGVLSRIWFVPRDPSGLRRISKAGLCAADSGTYLDWYLERRAGAGRSR